MTSTSRDAVLVTGASTGIGRACVERLAAAGWSVFAGARKPADLTALSAIPGVTALALDVRDAVDVSATATRIRASGQKLAALVNNAGLGGIGFLASFTDDEVHELFDVNVLGVVRMTRACLPLILASKGRIVTIGSQGGSVAMKYYAPYTMTKHALEAFTKALDDEIRPHGARAAIVQPGGVLTAIGENSARGDRDRFRRAPAPFDVEAKQVLEHFDDPGAFDPDQPEGPGNRNPCPPDEVARVVESILDAPDPPLRTLVGTRWEGNRVLDTLMDRIAEANDCPSLNYSVDDLVDRLRARLGRPKG